MQFHFQVNWSDHFHFNLLIKSILIHFHFISFYLIFFWRYGGFSLGGSATQTTSPVYHVPESVGAIRTRYQVPQVEMRVQQWFIWFIETTSYQNVPCFKSCLFFQNSSLDQLLNRLPDFLQSLNSQNNVKVCVFFHVFSSFCLCTKSLHQTFKTCSACFSIWFCVTCLFQLSKLSQFYIQIVLLKCFSSMCSGVVQ